VSGPRAGEVVRDSLRASAERLCEALPVIEAGEDPEGVHQARVALRRLRCDLNVYAAVLDPAWAKDLRAELRWLGRALGEARDADVLFERLRDLPWTDEERERVAPVLAALREQDQRANMALRDLLASDRATALVERVARSVDRPAFVPNAHHRAATLLPELLRVPLEELRASAEAARQDPADERLHAVRIAAKHVRYAADTVAPVLPAAPEISLAAEELQEILGAHQDAVVAEAWLRRFGDDDLDARQRDEAAEAAAGWEPALGRVFAAAGALAA
jgi:CHAD domain-containing protein